MSNERPHFAPEPPAIAARVVVFVAIGFLVFVGISLFCYGIYYGRQDQRSGIRGAGRHLPAPSFRSTTSRSLPNCKTNNDTNSAITDGSIAMRA